ncbi:MAG: sulfatase-like hydrolase/transferase [Verrucomicrobiales bacterium]
MVILEEAQRWASMSVPMDDRHPGRIEKRVHPHSPSGQHCHGGIRFSDFYAASPRCTPTRAALFTGRSPAQLHMTFVGEGKQEGTVNSGDKVIPPQGTSELPAGIATIGTLLKQQGYATAHFGKWHCGRISPREHGFDETDGPNSNAGPENVENPNPKQGYAITELGMDFIARQVTVGKPFYLQLSRYPGKGPLTARADTLESVKGRLRNENGAEPDRVAAESRKEIDKDHWPGAGES